MTRLHKWAAWTAGIVTLGVVALAITVGHDAECTPAPAATAGSEVVRAVVHTCYGGPEVLQVTMIDKPAPGPGQVLVRVHAAAVNPLDWHYMRGKPYIMRLLGSGVGTPSEPRLGVDFAGVVETVGAGVTKFQPGDAVFGGRTGAFGDYVVIGQDRAIAHMPENVTFAEAAAVPIAAVTALQAVRDHGAVTAGQRVLINGASGGVGSYAVQIAKALGAEVTGVCSTRNVELVRSLGADQVIDYTQSDYTGSGERWDVIVDMVGNHSIAANRAVLTKSGRLVMVGGGGEGDWIGPLIRPLSALAQDPFVSQDLVGMLARLQQKDLEHLADSLRSGEVRPVIDRHYPLDRIADAIRYSETGRARGKIIINMP